ncbi:MAG: MerR family transcriptional regulator, partial [Myxococcales bacterium]|nr:MerR family transcriptional regulator [Myxococcales bacterium]
MTIGELAKMCGVGVETIRYYERRGLIPDPRPRKVGYREFSNDDVRRVRFVKQAQGLGFTLKEIAELLALRVSPT